MSETTLPAIRSDFADDPGFAELLEMFVDNLPDQAAKMRAARESDDYAALKVVAHQLKGSGGGYGFGGVSQVAAKLEAACLAEDVDAVDQSLQQLLNDLGRITV